MAIKLKKKQEKKRNTPLNKFVAAAFLPLLLAFFGGFSVGNTNAVDKKNWHNEYQNLKIEHDNLINIVSRLDTIINSYDSLKTVLMADSDDVLRELLNAYKTGDQSQINQWKNRTYYGFDGKWTRMITDLNAENEVDKDFINKKPLVNLLQEVLLVHKQHINAKELHQQSVLKSLSANDAAGDANQNQITLLQMQHLAETNQLNGQIGQLQMQLNNCQGQASGTKERLQNAIQSKTAALNNAISTTTVTSNQNSSHVAEILSQIQSVRQEIIPDMRAGFLGRKRGRIEEIKDELSGVLNNIAESAGKIE